MCIHVAVSDKTVNQVYDDTLQVLQFFQTVFEYNSLNGQNMPVVSSVHAMWNILNASWYGVDTDVTPNVTYNQMVYSDGLPGVFLGFANCLDVIGHEMTHAITQFNSHLKYENEPGALNEHLSDVFGVMAKQSVEKKMAKDTDWLVGEDCFLPEQKGTGVRNMKNPGTAYKAQFLLGGDDPQPANVAGKRAFKKTYPERVKNDHGGVHIFSDIPNRAFVICALAFGGFSREKAGKIWWTTAMSRRIPDECTFLQFADITVLITQEQYMTKNSETVRTV